MNKKMDRRKFLKYGASVLSLFIPPAIHDEKCGTLYAGPGDDYAFRALHWQKLEGGRVRCLLCPNECVLGNGDRGQCRARENRKGTLYSVVYSRIAALNVDPVEKKPFYHFLPGSMAMSVATAGCNFSCKFCQNWQLSQSNPDDVDSVKILPDSLASRASASGSRVLAFTYNEPIIQAEYVIDASRSAKSKGIRPVIVSNGYIQQKATVDLIKNLDAVRIDLKSFSEKFYSDTCSGSLKPVLNTLEAVCKGKKWLEIIVLIIPTLNDSLQDIKKMSRWIRTNLSPDVPVHFTRFRSMYLIKNLPPTPVRTLELCRETALSEGLNYAYVGNVPGHEFENTFCHSCKKLIIKRSGYFHIKNGVKNGRCPHCGKKIPGVWA